jgi:hypothetical protein
MPVEESDASDFMSLLWLSPPRLVGSWLMTGHGDAVGPLWPG